MLKPNHARSDRYHSKSVQEETRTTTNTNKQTSGPCRDRRWVSCFPWIYLAGYGGKSSPAGHEPTGQKLKSVQKPTYFVVAAVNLSYVAIPACYPWASLSLSFRILPSRSHSTPHKTAMIASLCHIQRRTRWQSLSLCTNLTFKKDGSVCFFLMNKMQDAGVDFSESYWTSYKRGLPPLWISLHHTNASVGLCVSCSA